MVSVRRPEATLSSESVVRYEWPGKFTEVYSPAHSDFRPSYCEEPELWFGFEIELATSDPEACDRVVIGIRRWSDQVRWSFGVVAHRHRAWRG